MIDLTLSHIPPRVRARPTFYHDLILRNIPSVAGVKYGRSGIPIRADRHIQRSPALAWMATHTQYLLKRFFPGTYGKEARGSIPHAQAIRADSRPFVEQVLARSEYIEDFFDGRAMRKMLDEHIQGLRNAYYPLNSILTFALWRKQFCDLDGPGM